MQQPEVSMTLSFETRQRLGQLPSGLGHVICKGGWWPFRDYLRVASYEHFIHDDLLWFLFYV